LRPFIDTQLANYNRRIILINMFGDGLEMGLRAAFTQAVISHLISTVIPAKAGTSPIEYVNQFEEPKT